MHWMSKEQESSPMVIQHQIKARDYILNNYTDVIGLLSNSNNIFYSDAQATLAEIKRCRRYLLSNLSDNELITFKLMDINLTRLNDHAHVFTSEIDQRIGYKYEYHYYYNIPSFYLYDVSGDNLK